MNHEPTVEFDMESVMQRLDGDAPNASRDREIAERAVRAFASLVIPKQAVRLGSATGRCMCLRLAVAVYLLRIPGHERFRSLADIADQFGVCRDRANRAALSVARLIGLPRNITKYHKKRRK